MVEEQQNSCIHFITAEFNCSFKFTYGDFPSHLKVNKKRNLGRLIVVGVVERQKIHNYCLIVDQDDVLKCYCYL